MLLVMSVSGGSVGSQTDDNTGMLNGFIAVIQLGTHGTHILSLGIHQKLLHPVHRDDLRVIIEKQDIISAGEGHSQIIHCGVIKFPFINNNCYLAIFTAKNILPVRILIGIAQQLAVIPADFLRGAVVLHNDNLIIIVGGFLPNGADTPAQILRVILVGDDHGHLGRTDNLIADAENRLKGSCSGNPEILKAVLPQMLRYCSLCRLNGIGLCINPGSHTARMTSPIIHQSGHMHDFLRIIRETQNHIVVLAPVEFRPKQLITVQKGSCKHAEMTDIIIGTQIIRCKIRLKMHGKHLIDIAALEGGLITVQIICPLLIDGLHILVQHGGMQNIILVKQSDILSGRKL